MKNKYANWIIKSCSPHLWKKTDVHLSLCHFIHFIILSKQFLTMERKKIIFGRIKSFFFISFNRLSTTVYGDATTRLFIHLLIFRFSIFKF